MKSEILFVNFINTRVWEFGWPTASFRHQAVNHPVLLLESHLLRLFALMTRKCVLSTECLESLNGTLGSPSIKS